MRPSYCLCLLALGGCLLSGYDELPLPPPRAPSDASLDDDAAHPERDAGLAQPDIDAGAQPDLDAGADAMLDAGADGEARVDGGDLGSVAAYCRTRPCGAVKQCTRGDDCALSCGPLDHEYAESDAGRREVDCTFDCSGSAACETSCGPSLRCQTACVGVDVCQSSCGVDARCEVYCGARRCKGECAQGSRCTFDCRGGACDGVVCRAGASCLLRCDSVGTQGASTGACTFALCESGTPERCGDGRAVVCGRPCPTMR